MKRILSIAITLAMCCSATLYTLQSLANNRDYNRHTQWKSDTNANPDYASCIGSDSDGTISAYATISVDVDRVDENFDKDVPWWKKVQPQGVDYSAYANIWADASTGTFSVSASVPGAPDGLSGDVNGDTYREATASDFDWMKDEPGHVENYIGNASSSGTVSIPGFSSKAKAHDFGVIGDS